MRDQMRGIGDARAIAPHAGDTIATLNRHTRPHRNSAVRSHEITVRPEKLSLCSFRPVRCNGQRMARRQRQAPADGRMTVRNLEHRTVEGRQIKLVPTEHARLQGAIESSLAKGLVELLRVRSTGITFILLAL